MILLINTNIIYLIGLVLTFILGSFYFIQIKETDPFSQSLILAIFWPIFLPLLLYLQGQAIINKGIKKISKLKRRFKMPKAFRMAFYTMLLMLVWKFVSNIEAIVGYLISLI